jgi:hypothetical protein
LFEVAGAKVGDAQPVLLVELAALIQAMEVALVALAVFS